MRRQNRLLAHVVIMLSTAGCANLNTAFRDLAVDDGSGAMVDIKQRAILVSTREVAGHDGRPERTVVVCAEPSPDALSAFAAELAAEATLPQTVSASLAGALQESSGFVGLRTQSIQLLRDQLYRICEAYMNGAISSAQYDILVRRNQKYTVALLGIEQLTGVLRSPALVIGTQGSAQAAQSLSSLREEAAAITGKISALEAERAKKETAAAKGEIDESIKVLTDDKQAILKAMENARGLAASGKAGVVEINYGEGELGGGGASQAMVSAVKEIVVEILRTDDTGQLCVLQLAKAQEGPKEPLTAACEEYVKNMNERAAIRNEMARATLQGIRSGQIEIDEEWLGKITNQEGFDVMYVEDEADPGEM